MKTSKWRVLTNGLLRENPNLVLLLGMCPSLAITTSAGNAIGMGLATMFVLVASNCAISLLRRVIPGTVRLPAYIVLIAGFVTVVSLVMEAYLPELYESLGLFLSLITVNCIILGRAELFASRHGVGVAALDGLGMGLGFTLSLLAIGSVRELLGAGTWFGLTVTKGVMEPITYFILPAGGFFVLGLLTALVNRLNGYLLSRERPGCAGCPSRGACGGKEHER